MNPKSQDHKQLLRDWVVGQANRSQAAVLHDDTPLLEQRIISSLQILELILFIERTTGRAVDVAQLQPGAFRSIDMIFQTFFGVPGHE